MNPSWPSTSWTCSQCGQTGTYYERPIFGASKPWLMDPPTCHPCFRSVYEKIVGYWAKPTTPFADATGTLTVAGRQVMAEHVRLLLDQPTRSVFEIALLAAPAVAVRVLMETLELTFLFGGGASHVTHVPGPITVDFARDLLARVATAFTLERKITA